MKALLSLTFVALLGAGEVRAQIPTAYTNLKVLPKDIDRAGIIQEMKRISLGTGMRCEGCHIGPPTLEGMNFASDAKETKRIARAMLAMVKDVNEEHLAKLEKPPAVKVECATCHRGQAKPPAIVVGP